MFTGTTVEMDIRVLGCYGSQLPGYNMTSFLVNGKILIDGGTVTSALTSTEQSEIEWVFVTHAHLDHVRDIMLLADNICYLRRENPLVILSTPSIIGAIQTYLFNDVIWPDFSSIPDVANPIVRFKALLPGETIRAGDLNVTVVRVNHVVETVGFVLESTRGSVIFIGDTGPTDEIWRVANRLEDLKAIFIETSLPDSMRDLAHASGHLTPSVLKEELMKLRNHRPDVYLYHMKIHLYESIRNEIAVLQDTSLHILHDGQIIRI